jgi:hypothetical protein
LLISLATRELEGLEFDDVGRFIFAEAAKGLMSSKLSG